MLYNWKSIVAKTSYPDCRGLIIDIANISQYPTLSGMRFGRISFFSRLIPTLSRGGGGGGGGRGYIDFCIIQLD